MIHDHLLQWGRGSRASRSQKTAAAIFSPDEFLLLNGAAAREPRRFLMPRRSSPISRKTTFFNGACGSRAAESPRSPDYPLGEHADQGFNGAAAREPRSRATENATVQRNKDLQWGSRGSRAAESVSRRKEIGDPLQDIELQWGRGSKAAESQGAFSRCCVFTTNLQWGRGSRAAESAVKRRHRFFRTRFNVAWLAEPWRHQYFEQRGAPLPASMGPRLASRGVRRQRQLSRRPVQLQFNGAAAREPRSPSTPACPVCPLKPSTGPRAAETILRRRQVRSCIELQWGRGSRAAESAKRSDNCTFHLTILQWGRGSRAAESDSAASEACPTPEHASTGAADREPRSRPTGSELLNDSNSLQWGRGSKAAESVAVSPSSESVRTPSFNGAAAREPRSQKHPRTRD